MHLGYYLRSLGDVKRPGYSRSVTHRRLTATVAAVVPAVVLAACGGSSSTPQSTLHSYLTAWSHGDWAAMRKLAATPPAAFTTANAAAFSGIGGKTPAVGGARVS